MDNRAMYTLSYGLFLLSAQADGFDNACIINTACQVTSTPNRLTIAVNNANFTTGMIEKSGAFNLSVLDETAPFSVFEHFGFRSGRDGSKLDGVEYARSENGLIYLPAHAAAYLSCKVESVTDLGTHKLFLAQVTDGETLSSVPGDDLRLLPRQRQAQARRAENRQKGLALQNLRLRLRGRDAAGGLHLSTLQASGERFRADRLTPRRPPANAGSGGKTPLRQNRCSGAPVQYAGAARAAGLRLSFCGKSR